MKNGYVLFGGDTRNENMGWIHKDWPIRMATRSKVWVCVLSLAGFVVSNPTGAWISVCCECCVLSGRGLCDELIARSEEFY
jgi:hypothetical protein